MMIRKKVIFVTEALWIGGIETALVNLLKQFDYEKYDVSLMVLRAGLNMLDQIDPRCKVLIADRDRTYSFDKPYRYNRLFHMTEETECPSTFHRMMMWSIPIIRWIENRLYIRYICSMMSGKQYDTAIIYSDVVAETTIRAIKAKKYLMFYHHGAMRHVYHDAIGYRRCSDIIAVSENQAKQLRKFVPSAAKKISVIHNLVDVDEIRRKANQEISEIFDTDKFNIVSVGRISHEKGMDLAVRACAKLVMDGHKNVRWWIVGDGPAMAEVKSVIEETDMEKYVILIGMKDNPYPYMKKADLYVQPSRFEGYPMTLLEVMALGQFVISTENDGAKEIITDGKNGILCEISHERIASKIDSVLRNVEKIEMMTSNVIKQDMKSRNQSLIKDLCWIID